MLIVLIMLDFSKGVKDAKAPGEILQTCKYRIIAAIVIFAIPLLVKIILNVMGNSTYFSACWNSANSTSIKIAENEYKEKEEINKIYYLVETHDTPITNKKIENNLELTITKFKIQCCDALAHHPAKLEKKLSIYYQSIQNK